MLRKAARGFTLIELMIVVAIIGILAAIAIPNFMKYQLKSKRTEGSVNVAAIRTAEIAYFGTHDEYTSAKIYPSGTPGSGKRQWVPSDEDATDFTKKLGWAPEGQVYFSYAVDATGGQSFFAVGVGDLDVDSKNSCWGYAKPNAAEEVEANMPDGATCQDGAVPADKTEAGWERVELLGPDNIF